MYIFMLCTCESQLELTFVSGMYVTVFWLYNPVASSFTNPIAEPPILKIARVQIPNLLLFHYICILIHCATLLE